MAPMAPRGRGIAASLLLALALATGSLAAESSSRTNAYIVEKDWETAALARTAVTEYCTGGWKGTVPDRDASRERLLSGMGGENTMLQVLEESNSQEELSAKAAEKYGAELIFAAGPVVVALLLVIAWFICCWTACPAKKFCRCCRICAAERKTHFIVKVIVAVIMGCLAFGIFVAGVSATTGFNAAVDGFDNLACTSAQLLDNTLQGSTNNDTRFIGMLPLLQIFHDLEGKLDDGSAMMTEIMGVLDRTQPIKEAVDLASATLMLFSDMMADPANNQPGTNLHHKCTFCTTLVDPLRQTSSALSSGIGAALSNARGQVDSQLTPAMRANLQNNIRSSTAPLKEVKNSVRDTFSFFVDTQKFQSIKQYLNGDTPFILVGVMFIIMIACLLMLCGGLTVGCFLCREKPGAADRKNPYNKHIHRCACVTWCGAWGYCVLAFMLGGILNAIGVPMTSLCLIMDDLDGQMIENIGPALGMNFSGGGEMVTLMIDRCFAPSNASASTQLLEILTVEENGTLITMREKVVDQVKDQIRNAFDAIGNPGTMPSMASSAPVQTLVDMIIANSVDTMIVTDENLLNDPTYQPVGGDPRGADGLAGAFISSVSCNDHTVGAGMGDMDGTVLPGVSTLESRLSFFGALNTVDPAGYPCGKKSSCATVTADPVKSAACNAGNSLMDLKRAVRATTFKCDIFADPITGLDCDPKNMVEGGTDALGNTIYLNDCMSQSGRLTRKSKTCSLTEFVTYVDNMAHRINKVMTRIDTVTNEVFATINTDLRNLVDLHIVDPIDRFANGVTCGFLATYYRQVIDSLCFQAIDGFRVITACYLACAILSLFLIILMYAIWRRTIDNYNSGGNNEVYSLN